MYWRYSEEADKHNRLNTCRVNRWSVALCRRILVTQYRTEHVTLVYNSRYIRIWWFACRGRIANRNDPTDGYAGRIDCGLGSSIILFVTEHWDSRERDVEHSQDLNVTILRTLIENHANALIKANGITDENIEAMSTIPGWGCFWIQMIYDGKARALANAGDTQA